MKPVHVARFAERPSGLSLRAALVWAMALLLFVMSVASRAIASDLVSIQGGELAVNDVGVRLVAAGHQPFGQCFYSGGRVPRVLHHTITLLPVLKGIAVFFRRSR